MHEYESVLLLLTKTKTIKIVFGNGNNVNIKKEILKRILKTSEILGMLTWELIEIK